MCKPPSITPTSSGLLVDSVRVLSRFVQRAKGLVKEQMSNVQPACRSRLRSARQVAQTLHQQAAELAQQTGQVAQHLLSQAQKVLPPVEG